MPLTYPTFRFALPLNSAMAAKNAANKVIFAQPRKKVNFL